MQRILGVVAIAGLLGSLLAGSVVAAPPIATTKISGGHVYFASDTCPAHHMIITLGFGPERPVHRGGGVSDSGWLDVQVWDENCSNPGVQLNYIDAFAGDLDPDTFVVHDLSGAFVTYQGLQIGAGRTLDLDIAMVAVGDVWTFKGSTAEYDYTGRSVGEHVTGTLEDSAGLVTMGDLVQQAVHPPDNIYVWYPGTMAVTNYVMH